MVIAEVKKDPGVSFPCFPKQQIHPERRAKNLECVRKILGLTLTFAQGIFLVGM